MSNNENSFLFRPHHLITVKEDYYPSYASEKKYQNALKPYSLSNAYTADASVIDQMSKNIATLQVEEIQNELFENRLEKDYWEDFIGKGGILSNDFFDSYYSFVKALLSASPVDEVIIRSIPDNICFTCQVNGPGKEGNHCTEDSMMGGNPDERSHRVLRRLIRDEAHPELSLKKDGNFRNSIIIASMGLIRDEQFLTYIYHESRKIWFNEY